ncbi:MAG: DUF1559 domain-containing protein, partial [Planctomycetaceae bacterium]|nr:DUF1559 domain-containing protein [Planctomycetaceae bacterium]
YNVFPPGWVSSVYQPPGGVGTAEATIWSWGAFILPQIEQTAIYNTVQPGVLRIDQNLALGGANATALTTPIAAFRCASDTGPSLNDFKGTYGPGGVEPNYDTYNRMVTNGTAQVSIATSNYVMVADTGDSITPSVIASIYGPPLGVGYNDSKVGIRDITDGTSNTLIVGERAFKFEGLTAGAGNALGFSPATSGGAYANQMCRSCLAAVGIPYWGINQSVTNAAHQSRGFSSVHPGGAQFLVADGAVRFISDNIDHKPNSIGAALGTGSHAGAAYVDSTFEYLLGINDGFVVGEF